MLHKGESGSTSHSKNCNKYFETFISGHLTGHEIFRTIFVATKLRDNKVGRKICLASAQLTLRKALLFTDAKGNIWLPTGLAFSHPF